VISQAQKIKNAQLIKKAQAAVKALRSIDLGNFDQELEYDFDKLIKEAMGILDVASDMNREAAGE
jgi:hypothetical protein